MININTHAAITDIGSIGIQTECALLRFVGKIHGNCQPLRVAYPPLIRFLFDRDRKSMSTVIPYNGMYKTFVKDVPDVIINLCNKYITPGKLDFSDMTDDFVEHFMNSVAEEGDKTFRTLSLAFKDTEEPPKSCRERLGINLHNIYQRYNQSIDNSKH